VKTKLTAAVMLLLSGTPAFAHRLDEYLQATLITVEKNRIAAEIRLTPGVLVFPIVFASIDTDANHVISESEQRGYEEKVLRDLSLAVDGNPLRLRLVSAKFPSTEEMKEGLGEIEIEFEADVPFSSHNRRLIFENHHQSRIGAYLVNCLVSRDPDIRLGAQHRNYSQSFYQLDYVETGASSTPFSHAWWSGVSGAAFLLAFARIAWLWRARTRRLRPLV